MTKTILLITYYWPPAGGPGVQRWLKLTKYLSEYDFKIHVLTVDEEYASYSIIDRGLSKDIHPRLNIIRTKSVEILNLYKKVNKELPASGFANSKKAGLKEKLLRAVRGNFFIPDARKGWNKFAYKAAEDLIKEHPLSLLITTGPPHSTHLIGLKLKKKYPGLNWFADFRDPWSDIYYNDLLFRSRFVKNIDLELERKVLKKADHIITVGKQLKENLLKNVNNEIAQSKITIIPNGFDPDDFSSLPPQKAGDYYKVMYLGTALRDYPFEFLLKVLQKQHEKSGLDFVFEIVGIIAPELQGLIARYQKGVKIIHTPYINHSEVPGKLNEADALVLIIPDLPKNELMLTGKIFEYLAVKKPIIGIGPEQGDAAIILKETRSGKMINYNDFDGLADFIHELCTNKYTFEFNSLEYSRKYQAAILADIFQRTSNIR